MSFKLDYAYIGFDAEPCNLKSAKSERAGTESGIESASSSSSLDELAKEAQQTNKPIVTGAVYIPPQVSSSKGVQLPERTSAIDLVVMYRGKVDMPNPVPYERFARTRTMKLHAKTLQNSKHCRFLKMRIEEESIKFYPLDPLPQTLLLEIECHQLDLVKQSKKDICFFYFTTDTTRRLDTLAPPTGLDSNFSGYTCYVFHGTCPRTADRAHRLIKNFVDLKMKAQIYSLNPHCNLAALPEPVTLANQISELKVSELKPLFEPKPEPKMPSLVSSVDLLLNIDDLSESTDITSPVSMFDNLAPAIVNKCNTETSNNFDLLGEILSPQVNPEDDLFAKQHHKYGMQMASGVTLCSTGVQPAAVTDSVNPFMKNNNLASLLSSSQPNKSSPQPSFINPFVQPQQMVPIVPLAPTKLVPNHPNLSSVQATAQVPNYSSSNPFGASAINSYPQYPSASSNPFVFTNQGQPNVKLSSDFDEFLSQTMKAQFKK